MPFFAAPRHGAMLLVFIVGTVVVAAALLFVLHQAPPQTKKRVITAATFLAGLFYVLEFFLPANTPVIGNPLSLWKESVGNAVLVIGGFAFGLGIYNLLHVHASNIRRRRPDWYNSVILYVAFAAMFAIGLAHDAWRSRPWLQDWYRYLFNGLWQNLDAAMFSLLAFYIVSAAYRAFRVRSGEAALLMVTALILMMGQVPLGMALTAGIATDGGRLPFFGTPYSLFRMENFSRWILMHVNMPALRAIDFGIGLGALAMALRIWLSLERGTYFKES
jgi:hypothetical protein